jgi:hypothetical protein
MRSEEDRSHAHRAFGHSEPPHAREAFVQRPPLAPGRGWRLQHVAVLLACMSASIVALLTARDLTHERASRSVYSATSAPTSPSACEPGELPRLASVTPGQLQALRADAEAALAPANGRGYEWGTVTPSDLWSDDVPERGALEAASAAHWPGSFEVREWAPDPQWGASYSDDIVADAFLFATAGQARQFFRDASNASCRNSAVAAAARQPIHARTLSWVNPDGERQEDLFMLSGRLVYRLADVRPQYHRPPPSRSEIDEGLTTVEALGCGMQRTRCVRATVAGGVHA